MKRKFIFFITLMLITVISASAFGACTPPARETAAAYTVRFNDNYEGDYAKVEVKSGEKVTLPADPERVGYKFVGWYLSDEDSTAEAFDASDPIEKNLTVYAKWQKNDSVSIITLKFLNYTTPDAVYSVNNGSVFAAPETPVYDENDTFGFVNWYTDEACTSAYDFSAPVNSDTTLYAGWVKRKAYVKFDYNYTACPEPATVIVEIGKTVGLPENPVRDQYEFSGWYNLRSGGIEFDASAPIASDTTLYAHWSRSEYMISFDVNGATLEQGVATNYVIKRDASGEESAAAVEAGMTYVGHDFGGWYLVKTDPDSGEPLPEAQRADLSKVGDDMILYAGWTLSEYEVKFDYQYEGAPPAPATQTVKYGKLIEDPGKPEREGWLFVGWFVDAACTDQFTLDMSVSGNMTLYAKWIEDSQSQQNVTVTYNYNAGAGNVTHAVKSIEFNSTASSDAPENPAVTDYYFAGWYEDAAFTRAFNLNRNLIEDITVYGKMLKKYTFEAEAVNLAGKTGQGTSTNSVEEQMIMDYTFVKGGNVSNGYFIRELYYNGAVLDFDITSAAAVTDAVLYLRVSSESYEFFTTKEVGGVKYNYLSDKEFKIIVNGEWDGDVPMTWLDYGGLYMPMANVMEREDLAQNKTPFEDYFVISGLNLREGRNVISLYVDNNNNHGGTYHAEAPIIDCMYIYSSAELTMHDYKYYERPNVTRG